jgi:hypothetical protein
MDFQSRNRIWVEWCIDVLCSAMDFQNLANWNISWHDLNLWPSLSKTSAMHLLKFTTFPPLIYLPTNQPMNDWTPTYYNLPNYNLPTYNTHLLLPTYLLITNLNLFVTNLPTHLQPTHLPTYLFSYLPT